MAYDPAETTIQCCTTGHYSNLARVSHLELRRYQKLFMKHILRLELTRSEIRGAVWTETDSLPDEISDEDFAFIMGELAMSTSDEKILMLITKCTEILVRITSQLKIPEPRRICSTCDKRLFLHEFYTTFDPSFPRKLIYDKECVSCQDKSLKQEMVKSRQQQAHWELGIGCHHRDSNCNSHISTCSTCHYPFCNYHSTHRHQVLVRKCDLCNSPAKYNGRCAWHANVRNYLKV
jgi:hypothetical protein